MDKASAAPPKVSERTEALNDEAITITSDYEVGGASSKPTSQDLKTSSSVRVLRPETAIFLSQIAPVSPLANS